MTTSQSVRRPTISLLALLGAITLLFTGLTPAHAERAPDFDPDASRSLVVHYGSSWDGSTLQSPINGAQVTVSKVTGIDLRTDDGWLKMKEGQLTVAEARNMGVGQGVSKSTENGQAKFSELDIGVYIVDVVGSGGTNLIFPAQSFLVSLPASDGEGGWTYNVEAYPKNSMLTVGHEVADGRAKDVKGGVDWKVNTEVPYVPAGQDITSFVFTYELGEGLSLDAADILLAVNEQVLPAEGNYAVSLSEATSGGGQILTIEPQQDALNYLKSASGQRVELTIPTIVEKNSENGVITNNASITINNQKSHPAISQSISSGALRVINVAPDDAALRGASFNVLKSGVVVAEFATDENGIGLVDGLKADEIYTLKQVEAPAGYRFAASTGFTVERGGEGNPLEITVTNSPVPAFELPVTGGLGSLPFLLGGLLLILTALVAHRFRRRRMANAGAVV